MVAKLEKDAQGRFLGGDSPRVLQGQERGAEDVDLDWREALQRHDGATQGSKAQHGAVQGPLLVAAVANMAGRPGSQGSTMPSPGRCRRGHHPRGNLRFGTSHNKCAAHGWSIPALLADTFLVSRCNRAGGRRDPRCLGLDARCWWMGGLGCDGRMHDSARGGEMSTAGRCLAPRLNPTVRRSRTVWWRLSPCWWSGPSLWHRSPFSWERRTRLGSWLEAGADLARCTLERADSGRLARAGGKRFSASTAVRRVLWGPSCLAWRSPRGGSRKTTAGAVGSLSTAISPHFG